MTKKELNIEKEPHQQKKQKSRKNSMKSNKLT